MHRRLLFIFAHPDDETYGPGGSIAKYASLGWDVHLVSATDGEAGRIRSGAGAEGDPATIRRGELEMAAEVLGIRHVHYLHYPDGQLDTVPRENLTARLRLLCEQISPHVVVTFEPRGINGHPDHRVISSVTAEVFSALAPLGGEEEDRAFRKLYYYTIPSRWLNTLPWLLHPRRRRKFTGTPLRDITTVVDVSAHAQTKEAACRCHRSQFNNFKRIKRYGGSEYFSKEYYILASTSDFPLPSRQKESDLTEGL